MNIGVFSDSYKPHLGGVVRSIESFSEDLRALGHRVYIFAPSYPNAEEEQDVYRFPSIPSPTYKGFYLALPFFTKLERILEQSQLDVIHVHSPFIMGRLGARVAKRLGLPLVFTYHTLYDQYTHYVPFAKAISREITRKLSVDFCNRCDLVITPTEIISKYIKEIGVRTRVDWLLTGIQLAEFNNADNAWLRSNYEIGKEDKILLFVGRAGKEKNIPFIIDSFANINKEQINTKLVIVGEGPETEHLKKYVRELGLIGKVIFTGKLARNNLINAYSGADIFVFGSLTETQGIVIAEAKAAGLPVVAVKAFGVSNMVKDGEDGFLVPPQVELFSGKVMKLINDSNLRSRMRNNALNNANEFSSIKSAETLLDLYGKIINNAECNNESVAK